MVLPRSAAEVPVMAFEDVRTPPGARRVDERSPLKLSQQLGSRCAVCSHPFGKLDKVKQVCCGHIFHASCADKWLVNHFSCRECGVQVVFPVVAAHVIEGNDHRESDLNPATGPVYAEAIPIAKFPVNSTDATRYATCRDCGVVFYRDPTLVKPDTNAWYRCSSCRRVDIAELVWGSCSLQ